MHVSSELVGQATLQQIRNSRQFRSLETYKDARGNFFILVTGSPVFLTDSIPQLTISMTERVPMSRAFQACIKNGRVMPTQQDLVETKHVRLSRAESTKLQPTKAYPVYFVYI